MIRQSAALRSVASLLFSVLIAGRLTAAYLDGNQIEIQTAGYLASPILWVPYEGNAGETLLSVVTTTSPTAPQVEIIAMDRTGRPVNGIPGAYQTIYDEGFGIGHAAGYKSGFATGQQRGTSEGTTNGLSDGYNKGWGESYQPAFDLAYNTQLPIGKAAGWKQGHVDGFAEGYDWAPVFAGTLTAKIDNPYGSGTAGGITISSGIFSINSNLRFLKPDEVPTFYYDLGWDDGNKEGVSIGSTDGYNLTYPDAYAAAYPVGYQDGTAEGTSEGSADGKSEGFSAGWELGYEPGFDSGFAAGIQHYFSGQQSSSSYGILSIELAGLSAPADPLLFGSPPALVLGATGDGADFNSESNVPEPTSVGLLCVATAAIMLGRAGRK